MTVDILIFTGTGNPIWQRAIGAYRIATELRANGYSVQVVDEFPTMIEEDHSIFKQIVERYVGSNTLWVGFSSTFFINKRNQAFKEGWNKSESVRSALSFNESGIPTDDEFLSDIKQTILDKNSRCKLVMGGGKSSLRAGKIIDIYVDGYADSSVIEMTRWIEGKNPFFQVSPNPDGVSVSVTSDPKAQHFDFVRRGNTRWHESDHIFHGEGLPIEISRGCIFNCSFCSYPLNGKKKLDYIRDPGELREEFTRNYEQWGITEYMFADDTHNDSIEKLELLYNEVYSKLSFKIHFVTYLRLDLIAAKPEMAQLLLDSGLRGCFFGIESLNYESARTIGKGLRPERAIETLHSIKEIWGRQVMTTAGFIAGLPYDTEETINTWGDLIASPDFPLDYLNVMALGMFKNNTNRLWSSDLDRDPEKYGYYYPDDSSPRYWENKITGLTYNRAQELANDINQRAAQYRKSMPVLFAIPSLLGMGYTFEQLMSTDGLPDLNNRHSRMIGQYFNRLLHKNG